MFIYSPGNQEAFVKFFLGIAADDTSQYDKTNKTDENDDKTDYKTNYDLTTNLPPSPLTLTALVDPRTQTSDGRS